MGRFRSKAGAKKGAGDCCAVQTGHPAGQPFCSWQSYGAVTADAALYRNLRENIPILDAAIGKLVRLTGGLELLKKRVNFKNGMMDIYLGMKKFIIRGQSLIIFRRDVFHRHIG